MMKKTLAVAALMSVAFAGAAEARDQIRIVGSSTVFPFATAVAEEFGKTTSFKTPVIESTGSGGGLKLFCAGVGEQHPDITNASRRIKKSEVETCAKNGISEVTEVKVGYDGIVLSNSNAAPQLDLTKEQIFLALAKTVPSKDGQSLIDNPYSTWAEIDPSLPDVKIEVLGPPPTSGTRDAFTELVLEEACDEFPAIAALKDTNKDQHKAVCAGVREDGAYVEAGENDNLIVQKLEANHDALGIFGFSFLDQNGDKLQGSLIGGVAPTFEAISAGDYPVSRSLFFYVKNAHVGTIPGIKEYLAEFTADKAWGEEGYLADRGLIPMDAAEREAVRNAAMNLSPLSM
ncbi:MULTISPECIES: PstS family phosphate ABC transporter substrate-binding protein [Thalassospira]|jgi:phosphate transport system substrate-binding protein|nr:MULTISPECIES: PstS family phosphate ABC transporter substrate-binding protein [Thalassospira]KZC98886.1 phosphate ABC transporter substrate-binding protein [Thalassospira sp. MCCC 1A02898]NJB73693.1 phosphate transport system substrate-binding protein [Thalassospira tepidiphila]